jgi:hypothetical protein
LEWRALGPLPRLIHSPLSERQLKGLGQKERLDAQNARRERQDAARGTLLQAIAASVLLLGAYQAYRQLHVAREGQITERFTRAIDQLGSDRLDVRLGGIYGLARIAKDSAPDRATIIEILSAFVRERTPWPPPEQADGRSPALPADTSLDELPSMEARRADVQAAVTVLVQGLGIVRACLVGDGRVSGPDGCGAGTAPSDHVGIQAHDQSGPPCLPLHHPPFLRLPSGWTRPPRSPPTSAAACSTTLPRSPTHAIGVAGGMR